MAFPEVTLIANRRISIDAKFAENRYLRQTLREGQRFRLPDGVATVAELALNPEIAAYIDRNDLRVELDPGITVSWRFPLFAGAATAPDTTTLVPKFDWDFQPTYIALRVVTSVALATVQVFHRTRNAPIASTTVTEAMDPSGSDFFHAASQFPIVPKGNSLQADRSNESFELILVVMGLRITI